MTRQAKKTVISWGFKVRRAPRAVRRADMRAALRQWQRNHEPTPDRPSRQLERFIKRKALWADRLAERPRW